jgi:hypothetical protein
MKLAPAAERHSCSRSPLEISLPRYFFHVEDGQSYTDLQGTELEDIQAARREAVRFAGSLLADQPEQFWGAGRWSMHVADEDGHTLFTLSFQASSDPDQDGSDS